MSHTVTIEEAAARLGELIGSMAPGDEIVLTKDDRPVARILPSPARKARKPGSCKGMLVARAEDDEHLKDFEGYMP